MLAEKALRDSQEHPCATLSGTQSNRQSLGELQKALRGLHLTSLAAHLCTSEGILFQGMNFGGKCSAISISTAELGNQEKEGTSENA